MHYCISLRIVLCVLCVLCVPCVPCVPCVLCVLYGLITLAARRTIVKVFQDFRIKVEGEHATGRNEVTMMIIIIIHGSISLSGSRVSSLSSFHDYVQTHHSR